MCKVMARVYCHSCAALHGNGGDRSMAGEGDAVSYLELGLYLLD